MTGDSDEFDPSIDNAFIPTVAPVSALQFEAISLNYRDKVSELHAA
jgi:hypothetical protein